MVTSPQPLGSPDARYSVPEKLDQSPQADVLIIMTGGTICMESTPAGLAPARNFLERCMQLRPELNDHMKQSPLKVRLQDGTESLQKSLSTPKSIYGKKIRYAVLEFETLLDSSSIDSKGWSEIATAIYRNYKLFDGFVVLHGTDSLAYTCSALSFMLENLGKPVILTGSQVPFSERKNDALENLLDSLDIAGHFTIPEVCLCFNSTLYRGNRTTKISASAFGAFDSPNLPPLATITAMDTRVAWNLVTRPITRKPFEIRTNLDINHVACLRIFPGIKPAMVEAVLKTEGLRGLVLETFGAGNAPSGPDNALTRVISDAVSQRGIVIVNVTQCLTGSVSPVYAPGMVLYQAGIVSGADMTTEAALTKLSYLLALPDASFETVTQGMATSIRGELTNNGGTTFKHPLAGLSSDETQRTALAYAIAEDDLDKVDDLLRYDELLDQQDYSGNTPLHLAATRPETKILEYLLGRGASLHKRNYTGRTPLFLAANAGLMKHVKLLVGEGGHLHPAEKPTARLHAIQRPDVWAAAGLTDSGTVTPVGFSA